MAKISTKDVINYSAYETLHHSYVKRSEDEENCTANRILESIENGELSEDDILSIKERVSKWFEYVNNPSNKGEYFESIVAALGKPYLDELKVGLIASSFSAFDKSVKFEESISQDKKSEYLGEEGDTITFTIKDYKLVKTGSSKFGGNSGKWYLYKVHDDKDNVIIFFSNHDCEFELSHSEKAIATITKLSEFRDVKQTNVGKVKFV